MKRFFDFFLSIIILIIISPMFLIISILIKIDSAGPIFFISKRVGQNGNNFNMIKFRTMFVDTETIESSKLKNPETKITKIGKILRKYSFDEIPQFICVLFGSMSIVGPRPALSSQHDLIKERKKFGIHILKPGITGYAQINGRDLMSINQKIAFEYNYLKNKSLLLDLKIIFKTIEVVVTQKGVSH